MILPKLAMFVISVAGLTARLAGAQQQASSTKPEVAAIYFPSWHRDAHYDSWYGERWNEWKIVESNPLRFPGHNRTKPTAEWGYFDEADPKNMARQIDLAVEHGIDVFVFDWYWYSGIQILHRPVEETLPKTPNKDKIKYALMWADHGWVNYFPYPYDPSRVNWLLPLRHSPENFERVMQHCIDTHFNQSNYWKVRNADGKEGVYFALFAPEDFIKQLGGADKAKAVLNAAREKVRNAGMGEVHFAAFTGIAHSPPDMKRAGFDSMTSYNVTTMSSKLTFPTQPFEEYDDFVERHEGYWDAMDTGELPYGPIVTVGWDCTPRWEHSTPWPPERNHYPYTPIVINNTPEKFGNLVRRGLRQMRDGRMPAPALFVNSWNEWTEGSALMPQVKYGDGYLVELKKALQAGPLDAEKSASETGSKKEDEAR